VEVVDEADAPLPRGRTGRLRYRGPGVATQYHLDPEASVGSFRDGWFYPGDLAEIDEAGYLTLRGRTRDVIIRGGINVHPGEIESVLREHPDIAEAAVVGAPSARLGEEIAAFLVTRSPIDPEALTAWCAERLAPYKVPRLFVRVDDLPRNSSGKVLKSELASRLPRL
jgi:acyl-CoA synthetase (AMP-forming)/AMP-acid ligase II